MSEVNVSLSVIIPTYNGKEKVVRCLRALETQSFHNFETIVVIDGSVDGTEEYLKSQDFKLQSLKIFAQENKGRAVVRNNGAKWASGDIILFIDDDIRLESTAAEKHISFHNKYKDSILVGQALEDESLAKTEFQKFRLFLSKKWGSYLGETLVKVNIPYITAANCSLPKHLFIELGLFEEQLNDAEDYDLAIRAQEKKVPVYFDPELIGWHDDHSSMAGYLKRNTQYRLARQQLKKMFPQRHKDLEVIEKQNLIHRIKFFPFHHSFWVRWIDEERFFIRMLPLKLRYKLYDWVLTANSMV